MDFSTILLHAHSGLRYLVLLAAVLSLGYSLFGWLRGRPWDRAGRLLLVSLTGLLDLQILIGLVLVFVRVFYPALWGHLTMMILAAVVAHAAGVVNKRRPPEQRSHWTAAMGAGGALVLIVGGILSIGRSIL